MRISEEKITEIVRSVCGEDIAPDTDLFAEERMDSYALISILSELEELGIEIDPAETGIESFSTLGRIIEIALKKQLIDKY